MKPEVSQKERYKKPPKIRKQRTLHMYEKEKIIKLFFGELGSLVPTGTSLHKVSVEARVNYFTCRNIVKKYEKDNGVIL